MIRIEAVARDIRLILSDDCEPDEPGMLLEISATTDPPDPDIDAAAEGWHDDDGAWRKTTSCPTAIRTSADPQLLQNALNMALGYVLGLDAAGEDILGQDVAGDVALIFLPRVLGRKSPVLDPTNVWYPEADAW